MDVATLWALTLAVAGILACLVTLLWREATRQRELGAIRRMWAAGG